MGFDRSNHIRGYRGGYLPHRRREIEKGLRDGSVRGVVSTNALELGIDIGALDVSLMAGYPGTVAATWQRATLAIAYVSGDARHANEVISKAMDFIEENVDGQVLETFVEIL